MKTENKRSPFECGFDPKKLRTTTFLITIFFNYHGPTMCQYATDENIHLISEKTELRSREGDVSSFYSEGSSSEPGQLY